MKASDLREMILEQFFPVKCPFCGKVISFREACCPACREKLVFLEGVCPRCGRKRCVCERLEYLDGSRSAFSYEGPVEEALLRFKFRDRPGFAKSFASLLAEAIDPADLGGNFDGIVYVPMERKRRRERGYNQAELLAKAYSALSGIPLIGGELRKVRNTERQHLLRYEERLVNLKDAFAFSGGRLDGKRILLIDDISTTGTTLETCAKVLKESGAAFVFGLTVAAAG